MRYKMTLTTDAEDLEGAVGNFQQLCSDLSTDPEDVETYVEEDPNGHVPAFTPISPSGPPKGTNFSLRKVIAPSPAQVLDMIQTQESKTKSVTVWRVI